MNEAQFDQLVDYVVVQLQNGSTDEAIEQALLKAGYTLEAIDAVFGAAYQEMTPIEPSKFQQALQEHDEQSTQALENIWYHLKHVRPFRGRLHRSAFLLALMYLVIVTVAIGFMLRYFADPSNAAELITSPPVWIMLISLGIFQNMLFYSIIIRRFHDIGVAGWWSLLLLIPLLNIGVIFYLLFKRGQDDTNRYGNKEHAFDPLTLLGLGFHHPQQITAQLPQQS